MYKNKALEEVFSFTDENDLQKNSSPVRFPLGENEKELKCTIEYCESRMAEEKKLICRLSNSPEALIIKLLEQTELARRQLRNVLPLVEPSAGERRGAVEHSKSIKDVLLETNENILLKLTLLPLCALPIRGSYNIYTDVFETVKKAVLDGTIVRLNPNLRYVLCYNRIVSKPLVLGKGRCDNDNFEMQRVTNAITDALAIADSVDKFSFFYTTTAGKDDKTEVYLLEEAVFLQGKRR